MLDDIDRHILNLLQQDAKKSIKEISAELHITKTPVYERIKRLERDGFISRYTAIVDPKKVERSLMVFCAVTLETHTAENIAAFTAGVRAIPEVIECFVTAGMFDLILKVVVRDLEAYHEFASQKLANLPNIVKFQSSFVMDQIKNSTNLPL